MVRPSAWAQQPTRQLLLSVLRRVLSVGVGWAWGACQLALVPEVRGEGRGWVGCSGLGFRQLAPTLSSLRKVFRHLICVLFYFERLIR